VDPIRLWDDIFTIGLQHLCLDSQSALILIMAILEVKKDNNRQLQNIANTIAGAKKVVVITGAGISTNCGIPVSIPSFLSEGGD